LPAGAALLVFAIGHLYTERHVRCDRLPHRFRFAQPAFQPFQLRPAEILGVGRRLLLAVPAIWTAIAAPIQHEYVQQRTVGDAPVDALDFARRGAEGSVLLKRPSRARHHQRDVLLLVERVVLYALARRPVIHDVVIVPLPDLADGGTETPQVFIEQVIA